MKTATGQNVYVGLVDTGIRREAKGLVNRNQNIATKTIDYDNGQNPKLIDTFDNGDHGTGMSEIILDTAPDVAINSGSSNPATDQVYVQTIGLDNLLVAMKLGVKIDILNNSYGGNVQKDDVEEEYGKKYEKLQDYYNSIYLARYKIFVENGVLVVKSTGNGGKSIMSSSAALPLIAPELEKGFLAVTAYNQISKTKTEDAGGELTKSWCITAPEIFNIYRFKDEKGQWQGTSTATAYVSGLATKIKSRYDWFTNTDLKNTLITTADDMGDPGVDAVWGNGLVNADRAVKGYGRFDKDVTLNVDGIKRAYFFDNDISGSGGVIKKAKMR